MPFRTTVDSNYHLYDPDGHRLSAEIEIAKIMFICGLDGSNVDSVTIDEIIDAIDGSFNFDKRNYFDEADKFVPFPRTGSRDLLSKRAFVLKDVVRRMWRELHLAKFQGAS